MTGVGAGCETPSEHAESATLHAFLNCYLRETDTASVVEAETSLPGVGVEGTVAHAPLKHHGVEVVAPLRYESATGRHLFDKPVYARSDDRELQPIDAASLAALARRELVLSTEAADSTAGTDLLRRVLASRRKIERLVDERNDFDRLYGPETTFRDAEQSLVYGHHFHPAPKSLEGIVDHDLSTYAPELRGAFQLRYFASDPHLITGWSARNAGPTEWIADALKAAEATLPSEAERALASDRAVIPVHPWQAEWLSAQPHVQRALERGSITDLGTFGPTVYPTSSVRTLWTSELPFMVKTSLAVEITNAERTSKVSELELGVAVTRLLEAGLADRIDESFPRFAVVRDPAALTVDIGAGPESGFETVLRENPFRGDDANDVSPVVALCQDGIDGPSRIARLIRALADRSGRPTSAVAREWFREYLAVTVEPVLWTYFELGLGFEAHQQNTLVRLDEDGWPVEGFYRDNEGFYVPESRRETVDAVCPGVTDQIETVCPDTTADDCVRYYVVLNNAFGVINALGIAGLADETALLDVLRESLVGLEAYEPSESALISKLLDDRRVPCKGNLRTRFEDRDELAAPLEAESVYIDIENPLVTRL
ncbi:IucA/IucC family protein [Halostagnicola kamekurae]|uniref:Siderophore synthetase component n=1 Tax=Halostagnicola kamekurae TaxID=619731 RepID=A0A1I6U890_9EURY|nr:IucA/IucC family protein [Halostagnicola kamekurae]SFS97680.1 Siderophore synthetase component [Halostagnicola kamekurae]